MTLEQKTRVVANIARALFWVAAVAVLVIAAVMVANHFSQSEPGIEIDDGSLASNSLSPIEIGQMSESNLVTIVNAYRTNVPWLSVSNDRIYAGLYDRYWSAEYSVGDYKNEAGLLFGTGFGAYYNRTIFGRFTIGGVLIIDADKNFEAFGTAGYKW